MSPASGWDTLQATNPLHDPTWPELDQPAEETGNDGAIAAALAEGSDQRAAEAAAKTEALDQDLALSIHEEEVQTLCRQLSAHLSRVPQLLEQQPLERQRSEEFSQRLATAQGIKLVPHVVPASVASLQQRPLPPEARQRLEARLSMYGLTERLVKGDGNCQFRALSDQLYRTPHLHAFVRECTVAQLRRGSERYQQYVPGNYGEYCRSMSRSGEWGDHITLQAAADYFGLRISVLTSFPEGCFIEIEPLEQRSARVLYLSFWAEVHYNSVYPVDDPPGPLPNDKVLGSRRLYQLLFGDGSSLLQVL